MIKNKKHYPGSICLLLVSIALSAGSLTAAQYETGFRNAARITQDLQRALSASDRQNLSSNPVLLEKVAIPFVQPGEYRTNNSVVRYVSISDGFINFANYLSHARSIDEYQRGFYRGYLDGLRSRSIPAPVFPLVRQDKAWSFDTMNHQVSHFNQIVAGIIAIDMAHHYLGHYRKYARQLVDRNNHAIPINYFLTPDEWHEAVMRGSRNALDCGFSSDGVKLLFDGLSSLKPRPNWSIYFLPENADVHKLARDLSKMEDQFFAGMQKKR